MDRCGSRLSRRQFMVGAGVVGVAGAGLLAGCGRLPWQGQEPAKVYRIGLLSAGSRPGPAPDGLRDALRELGYIEGQNVIFEQRYARESDERFGELAAELVRLPADVIVTRTTDITRAVKSAFQNRCCQKLRQTRAQPS
jgi:hypothetical protein